MAASSPDRSSDGGEAEPGTESEPDTDLWMGVGAIVKREPTVKLLSPVSGLEPLSWSEDHRISASSTNNISLMEIVCDVHGYGQDLIIHRTSIPVPDSHCVLKVTLARKISALDFRLLCTLDQLTPHLCCLSYYLANVRVSSL